MNYPTELQEMQKERESERLKSKCNGACFCTGRCMYTKKEWDELEKIKGRFRFTGVNEMINKVGD